MMGLKIGFIGAGKMGSALIRAIHSKSIVILATDRDAGSINILDGLVQKAASNSALVRDCDAIFLCTKPQHIPEVLDDIKGNAENKLIISIAAGITLQLLENSLPHSKCVRVMPNLPCLVGEMAAAYSLGTNCTDKDRENVHSLLNKAGVALELNESLLDAVTGLSGSGPAFVSYLIQSFAEAGREQGLPEEIAYRLSLQTFYGTALLLMEKNMMPDQIIEMVSSPNGTTIAGRKILEHSDVNNVIKKTIKRATDRSKEIGNG